MCRASYLALVAAAALSACGSGDSPPPADTRTADCPEIFASGFRNPWRWSFDRSTGDLWVGDVGQSAREEVDRVVLGGNYGWRCFEGTLPVGLPCGSEPNLLPPVAEYVRSVGTTVTGGYVYRGMAIPGLAGKYVFGDFGSRTIWNIDAATSPTLSVTGGVSTGLLIVSFGEDNDGELYVVDYTGKLYSLGGTAMALTVAQVFPGITPGFVNPVAMMQAPGDDSRWFVVEQGGRVRVFDNNPGVTSAPEFLNITSRVSFGGETGLLGMAFHPNFPMDPRVYVNYTNSTSGLVTRISEFTLATGGGVLDPNSERVLLTVLQPETNHNGGNIAFGPNDGYLYIGMGDGGGGNDIHGDIGNGQLMSTLLGKMLRIDVNAAPPYGIPASNPFAGNALCGV
jgi:glucose/arabinose dehydrogenase